MICLLSRSDSAPAPDLSTSRRNPLGSDFAEIFHACEWIAGSRWFHRSHGGLFGVNGGYDGFLFRGGRRWNF